MKKIAFIDLYDEWNGSEKELPVYIFKRQTGGFRFEKRGSVSSPEGQAEGADEFYLSLPLRLLNFRNIKVPFQDKDKLRKILPFELDGLVMSGSDNIVFDTIKLDEENVLAVYIEKTVFAELLAKLAASGIDPRIVTSIELRAAVNKGVKDIIPRLITSEDLTYDNRVTLAGDELLSPSINLRTGPLSYTRDTEEIRKTFKVTAGISLLLALVINAYLLFNSMTYRTDISLLKKEIRNIYLGLFPADKKVADELYQTKSRIKNIKEELEDTEGVYPLQALTDLSQQLPHGIIFNEISIDRDIVTLKGEAASMNDIGKMKTTVFKSMHSLAVSDIKPSGEGKMFFTTIAKRQ